MRKLVERRNGNPPCIPTTTATRVTRFRWFTDGGGGFAAVPVVAWLNAGLETRTLLALELKGK